MSIKIYTPKSFKIPTIHHSHHRSFMYATAICKLETLPVKLTMFLIILLEVFLISQCYHTRFEHYVKAVVLLLVIPFSYYAHLLLQQYAGRTRLYGKVVPTSFGNKYSEEQVRQLMESQDYKDYQAVKSYMGKDEEQIVLEEEMDQVAAEFEAMETLLFD